MLTKGKNLLGYESRPGQSHRSGALESKEATIHQPAEEESELVFGVMPPCEFF